MATIDYEKKYKEALKKARQLCTYPTSKPFISDLQDLFPELKENEDERIRKKLISFVQNWTKKTCDYKQPPHILWTSDKEECAKILAWLEKQGGSYTKKDVDDAYVEGMAFAKDELEKQGEQRPAWSEEDEERLQSCLNILQAKGFMGVSDTIDTKWLKSIRPQTTWKPSDEQMKLLREVQQALLGKDCHNRFVNFMYELKRLREE